jgi:SAM-dependent methyltransferase
VFVISGPWLRDDYRCHRCRSIPRERALVKVVKRVAPHFRSARVFESSPGSPSSDWLASHCANYQPSQYFSDVPRGECDAHGVRSEDLQALTLPDDSVDLFVTQDVLEHVLDPDAAFAEISRVLAPGGAHIWTVPIYRRASTVRRAAADEAGGIRHLMEPDYHGNPLGGGSLVIHEWGEDLLPRVHRASGLTTTRHSRPSWWNGIRGEMIDVLVSRKPSASEVHLSRGARER